MTLQMQKWIQTMTVSWSKMLVYKFNFFIQVIAPLIIFLFIKFCLWQSIFASSVEETIGGYTLNEMLSYHLCVLITGIIVQSSSSENLSESIRMGQISTYLIYPFSFWEFQTANYLARQILQTIIAAITILLCYLVVNSLMIGISYNNLILGISIALLGGLYWFVVQYLIGILSFWLEETWTLLVGMQIVSYFFSGAIIPIELYPDWLVDILVWTPFPYISYVPAKIMMGNIPPILQIVGVLGFWILVLSILSRFIWRKGLKEYTAAGI